MDLKKRLSESEELVAQLNGVLKSTPRPDAEVEIELLRRFLAWGQSGDAVADIKDVKPKTGVAKTSLRCAVPSGTVRCQARDGKIELAMERDFSGIDRYRLEKAISAFFAALEDEPED